jgi:ADP-heptose:LPS heptosyltransferase
MSIRAEDEQSVAQKLAAHQLNEFFVLNPGGGWRSKCWPASRYGQLHHKLTEKYGWSGVVTYGPGEEGLAREVVTSAGDKPPVPLLFGLGELKALMRRAKFVVSADTGPLHLACALNVPVIGLYGPTDPARNGPFSREDVVVRNPRNAQTTYRRGDDFSPSMLSITVDQAFDAVVERIRRLDQSE